MGSWLNGMLIRLCWLFLLSGVSAPADTVVAGYSADFSLTEPLTNGWSYLWNAPTNWVTNGIQGDLTSGAIGNPTNYVPLQVAAGADMWTADGDADINHTPDRSLRLTSTGGYAGGGSQYVGNVGRYAIAAYTVSESGFYALTNSLLGRASAQNDGIDLYIHINGRPPVYVDHVDTNSTHSFDTPIGFMAAEDTLYVCVGPDGTSYNDAFTMDFTLTKTAAAKVTGYRDDFSNEGMPANWRYQWNAPTNWNGSSGDLGSGRIGEASCYQDLLDAGIIWTADGDTDGSNTFPNRYLNLKSWGGMPGAGAGTSSNGVDRYAIAAYTVQSDGFYGIANSFLTRSSASGDSTEVLVHVNEQSPVVRTWAEGASTVCFDTEVGWLQSNDTIYVSFGPDGDDGYDNFSFDYDILYLSKPDIRSQVDAAANAGDPTVRIYPGRYYGGRYWMADVLLQGKSDLDINAYGTTLIGCNVDRRFVQMESCANITLRGLVTDYDPLIFSQGTITAVDANGSTIDMVPHEGYPVPNQATDRAMVHDPETMLRKDLSRDVTLTTVTDLGSGTYRLTTDLTNATDHEWEVGDYISVVNAGNAYPYYITESEAIHLVDIAVYSGKGLTIVEDNSSSCTYRGVQIVPGPRPLLASVDRLRSSHADGIHSRRAEVGPVIEDCVFEGLGDDAIAIRGDFGVCVEYSYTDTMNIGIRADFGVPGKRVRIYRRLDGAILDRTVVSVSSSPTSAEDIQTVVTNNYPWFKWPEVYDEAVYIQLNSPVVIRKGDLVSEPDRCGSGFEIRNNYIRNNRARAMAVKASEGVIEGNMISDIALAGILLLADSGTFMEADMVADVNVRSNIFYRTNVGWHSPDNLKHAGALSLLFTGQEFKGHRNVTIEDNEFYDISCLNIQVNNAKNITLNRNRFYNSHQVTNNAGDQKGADNTALVWMDYVDGVTLGTGTNANTYYNIGTYADTNNLVSTTVNALNVTGSILPGN